MQQKLKSGILLGAASMMVLTALVSFVPSATAQTTPAPVLAIENLKGPSTAIKPEVSTGSLTFTLRYTIQNQIQPAVGVVATTAVVTITTTCSNPNVFVQGPNTALITVDPKSTTPSYTANVAFSITVNRQAPGLQLLQCTVGAKAAALQGTAVPESNTASQNFQVTADYFPYISAKVTSYTLDNGPQKPIPFDIVVDNFGNAQTQVTFALANKPADKWNNIILPPPLTLDSPNSGGAKTEDHATLTVNTPYKNGWNNEEQAYSLTLTPIAALDNTKQGTPITVSMFARSRGIYLPGPEPVLVIAVLAGAVLVAKLARRGDDA